ncbi:hypothetical protein HZH66_014290 [Vespula vulgaris]|uniref:Uncharacterized protein n=1 Tax=Vespula vulgaris TaxID=7454 RepID=A0A834MRF2_VESVU|nr:hypothetical protein HZH66_014290 [Vespula vulgaris]
MHPIYSANSKMSQAEQKYYSYEVEIVCDDKKVYECMLRDGHFFSESSHTIEHQPILTREEKDNSEKRFVNKENDAVNDDMVPEETRSNIFSKRKEVSKSQEQLIAMRKLFSKLLNPINLDSDQLNSSEGEFDFSLLNDQITSIYEAIVNETNESNGQVTNLIIDSETAEDGVGSQWVRYEDFKKVPPGVQFVSGQKRVGLQITSNIKEQVDSLRRPDLPVSMRIPIHLYEMMLDKIPGAQVHDMFTDRH